MSKNFVDDSEAENEQIPDDAFFVVGEDGYNWEPERYVSRRAAEAAGSALMGLNPGELFYIGTAVPGQFPSDLADTLIQSIYEHAQMTGSKLDADEYICNLRDEAVSELNGGLVDFLADWGRRCGAAPSWFKVVVMEEVVVISATVGHA